MPILGRIKLYLEAKLRALINLKNHFVHKKCKFKKMVIFVIIHKGIVSRDWGGLQMILLDRYIVVNISAGGSF